MNGIAQVPTVSTSVRKSMVANVRMLVALSTLLLTGCATLDGDDYAVFDTNESLNRKSYDFTDTVDRNVLVPVARGYQKITPNFVERGIENVFANLRGLSSSANGFLQGKPMSGGTDLGRFLINSTIGLGGLFDPATSFDLEPQNEDLGQTFAVWGWRKSRYVYVPFMGPTTIRDLPSNIVLSYMPRLLLGSNYHWGYSVADVISGRAALLGTSDLRDASAIDPFAFTRDGYIQRRKYLIYDGAPPLDDLFDDFDEFDDESE